MKRSSLDENKTETLTRSLNDDFISKILSSHKYKDYNEKAVDFKSEYLNE